MIAAVLAPGPSSEVKNTVLPSYISSAFRVAFSTKSADPAAAAPSIHLLVIIDVSSRSHVPHFRKQATTLAGIFPATRRS